MSSIKVDKSLEERYEKFLLVFKNLYKVMSDEEKEKLNPIFENMKKILDQDKKQIEEMKNQ